MASRKLDRAPILADPDWREQLFSLKPGWDSYTGKVISSDPVMTVDAIAVVPCSNGGLQLELHQGGWDLEISISPQGKITSIFAGRVGDEN